MYLKKLNQQHQVLNNFAITIRIYRFHFPRKVPSTEALFSFLRFVNSFTVYNERINRYQISGDTISRGEIMPENRKQEGGIRKNTTERGKGKNLTNYNDHGRNRGNKDDVK